MTLIRSLCIAVVMLAATAGWASAAEPTLLIAIERGGVSVTSQGTNFTERELSALRKSVELEAAESPLYRSGSLQIVLRGGSLAALQARLRAADLDDLRDVRRATDRFLESYFEDTDLTEPIEWVIGRDYRRSAHVTGGSVVAVGSNLVIDGPIADVVSIGSRVELGPNADVTNRFATIGSQVELAATARIHGQEMRFTLPANVSDFGHVKKPEAALSLGARIIASIAGLLASFGLGMFLLRFAPGASSRTVDWLRSQPTRSLGFGVLYFLGLVPGALFLVLTILGIALLPAYFLVAGVLLWIAYVTTALWVGTSTAPRWAQWQKLLLGLVILFGLAWIPGIGGVVTLAATLWGAGAILQSIYDRARRRRQRRAEVPSVAAPSAEPMHNPSAHQRTT